VYLFNDLRKACGKSPWRLPLVLLSRSFVGIFVYRLERMLFLIFGSNYRIVRIIFIPIILILNLYSNCEIHYEADIGKGIKILHPSLGVVISRRAKVGNNLTMVGGNCIGISINRVNDIFIIGHSIEMGVNSSIIGPLVLGNNIKIGANACVVHSYLKDTQVLVGVPALPLNVDSIT